MKQLELFPELDIIRYAMSLTTREVASIRNKPEGRMILEIRMLTQQKIWNIRREQKRYKQRIMEIL